MNDSPGSLGSASEQKSLKILKLSEVSVEQYRNSLTIKVGFGASLNQLFMCHVMAKIRL